MHITSIADQARDNSYFRKVIFTGPRAQIVLMSVQPGEDIGLETHDVDQIICFVAGSGTAKVAGEEYSVSPGDIVYVSAGQEHNFINTGSDPMKLYTIYAPSEHPDGQIHETKADALAAEGH